MNCPLCHETWMQKVELEDNLTGLWCKKCAGHWIPGENYEKWLKSHGPTLPETEPSGNEPEILDSKDAKLCPECGRILIKFKIGHNVDFALEHCGFCKGLWFDKNEWELLKVRNLHDEINEFVTSTYQKKMREESSRNKIEQIYRDRFGEKNYNELIRLKNWIDTHPLKSAIMAFIADKDPFKP